MILMTLLAAALLPGPPAPPDTPATDTIAATSMQTEMSVLFSSQGDRFDDVHIMGGGQFHVRRGRFGAAALGTYGVGAGLSSTFAGVAPTIEIPTPAVGMRAFVGAARYGEATDHADRHVFGPLTGLSLRFPRDARLSIAVTALYWRGRLVGEGLDGDERMSTGRVLFGLSF